MAKVTAACGTERRRGGRGRLCCSGEMLGVSSDGGGLLDALSGYLRGGRVDGGDFLMRCGAAHGNS